MFYKQIGTVNGKYNRHISDLNAAHSLLICDHWFESPSWQRLLLFLLWSASALSHFHAFCSQSPEHLPNPQVTTAKFRYLTSPLPRPSRTPKLPHKVKSRRCRQAAPDFSFSDLRPTPLPILTTGKCISASLLLLRPSPGPCIHPDVMSSHTCLPTIL